MSDIYQRSIPATAGADLSTHQYKAVTMAGAVAADGDTAAGIQLNKPNASGKDLTIGYDGRVKYYAGAAVAAGARLTVTTSGWLITATSGTAVVGRNMFNAVTSGSVGEGIFNFASVAEQS